MVVVAAFLVVQVVVALTLRNTNDAIGDLRGDVAALESAGGTPAVDPDTIRNLGSGPASPGPTAEPPGAAAVVGNLPRFLGGGVDQAVGKKLGEIAGLEYYQGSNIVLGPATGVSRAYMVWAHWCPFCREELPRMTQWHAENAADLEHFELVTVTSAIDETAENPLVPYLDSSQFPFPVLVDEDGSLARQLGVSAFPFWVFTAPDGTVVGRAAGTISQDNLDTVFRQLDEMGASGPTAMAVER